MQFNAYSDLYNVYSDSDVHTEVNEVTEAESEFSEFLSTISDLKVREEMDSIVGKIARAYEMQGFNLGLNVSCGVGCAI